MKKVLIYIAGIITGIILTILISLFLAQSADNGITMFEKPGDCISANQLKVFQVIDSGVALAHAAVIEEFDGNGSYRESISAMADELSFMNGTIVLIINDEGKYYYDEEIIEIPSGKQARQVGVYKYSTSTGYKTVPIIKIME